MAETQDSMKNFVRYVSILKGDEKGEAHIFFDRLFQAFGHLGFKEAGAEAESRQKRGKGKGTGFIDLLWKPRLLLEMKKRGEKLQKHYSQAFDYWMRSVPHRPKYVVLCNFDEFWIYDFDIQLDHPLDIVKIQDLPSRYTALNFMFENERKPQFNNNRVTVTKKAAQRVANVYNSLITRHVQPEIAQKFILQSVVAMFSEDAELLKPPGLFLELLDECIEKKSSTYDLIGGLFRQMNTKEKASGGRYKEVLYFNGGIFKSVEPLELLEKETHLLKQAALEKWDQIQPAIFGTIFEDCMGKDQRHAEGAHYTYEADIQKVVIPTIVRPWELKIDGAKKLSELIALLDSLRSVKVLDPACGSGNFLYVAFRELVRLEFKLMARIHEEFGLKARSHIGTRSKISTKQFFGIEKNPLSVELAKVTLTLAKELTISDIKHWIDDYQTELPFDVDSPLPLDNLDTNIICDDALFCKWPEVDYIIGNPPFQSKNKAQEELGAAYLAKVRKKYPEIPGHADYCVYWFRRTHDELKQGSRAGLVGTKTIRETNSRIGGLDYIVKTGGTITEAVSRQVWSGQAAVDVSIVNWIKGAQVGKKHLYLQSGDRRDSPWEVRELDHIHAGLSFEIDIGEAIDIKANSSPKTFFQGITPGHEGYLVTPSQAIDLKMHEDPAGNVVQPYLIGDDILGQKIPGPTRYVINFSGKSIIEASKYPKCLDLVKKQVLVKRKESVAKEEDRNQELSIEVPDGRGNKHHHNFLNKWWQISYPREDLIENIKKLSRFIVCVRTTKRPIFEFVSPIIRPGDSLQIFAFQDDYSFGILQSPIHWKWFIERCSKLSARFRYTSETVYSTFPWPQNPTRASITKISQAAVTLRTLRHKEMKENGLTFRQVYRTMDIPGKNILKDAHLALDEAVRSAYGMGKRDEVLSFLFELNKELAKKEIVGEKVVGPGLPFFIKDTGKFITKDFIKV